MYFIKLPTQMTKNIVTVGGGTGSFTLLKGLKHIKGVNLTAIVPSTDSGGSSGRLMDEFGHLPPGDIRQCLIALMDDEEDSLTMRKLFNYRFDKGENGLKGHNFGNLFLTALTEIFENDSIKAIKAAGEILNIRGRVLPVTSTKTTLIAEYENGATLEGEHNIDEPPYPHDGRLRIVNLYTKPTSTISKEVRETILNADLIVTGPGDVYTSLCANAVNKGFREAMKKTKAKFVYVVNLVTKYGQTFGYTSSDHVKEITKYFGKQPNYVIVNNGKLPTDILKRYILQNDYEVINDLKTLKGSKIIRENVLSNEKIVNAKGDVLVRSLIRHDPIILSQIIENILLS